MALSEKMSKHQKILKDLAFKKRWSIWEQELALFLNRWGDLNEHPNINPDFIDGYKRAIKDIWNKFDFDQFFDAKYRLWKEKWNAKI